MRVRRKINVFLFCNEKNVTGNFLLKKKKGSVTTRGCVLKNYPQGGPYTEKEREKDEKCDLRLRKKATSGTTFKAAV